jgi:WbqC-like protein family
VTQVSILQPTYWARTHVWNRLMQSDVYIWLDSVKFARSKTKWEDRTIVEGRDGRAIVLRLSLRGSKNVLWSDVGLNEGWQRHERTIQRCYARYPYWKLLAPLLAEVYGSEATLIDEVCWRTMSAVAGVIRPGATFVRSSTLGMTSSKGDLILDLVRAVGGTSYLTGAPGAKYLPISRFEDQNISVEVQRWCSPCTAHGLSNPSIVHLLAEQGRDGTVAILRGNDPSSRELA